MTRSKSPAVAKFMRALHIYSSMLVLVLLIFFSVTGITLNHPNFFHSTLGKDSRQQQIDLPAQFHIAVLPQEKSDQYQLAQDMRNWLEEEHGVKASIFNYQFDLDDKSLELDFKRPASYASLVVDFANKEAELEVEFNGYLALFNDLHKGRNAGFSWLVLIDITAIICIVFALTGFYLLLKQASRRHIGNGLAVLGVVISIFAYVLSLH